MKSTIYSNKEVIGTADLWVGDGGMDNIYGQFLPNENYYMQVRKSVWEFNKIPAPDNTKWASLMLNVQLENGYFLFASNVITFSSNLGNPFLFTLSVFQKLITQLTKLFFTGPATA